MFRRIALVLLQNKDKKILMQHRDKDAPTNPDMWGLFGGHIREEEKPIEAAFREIEEELGLKVAKLDLFKRYDLIHINREVFIYAGQTNIALEQLKKQQTEGQGVGFFSLEELKDMKVVGYVMIVLKDYFLN